MKNKYSIGDKIRARIHYQNDRRTEVEATILSIELDSRNDNAKYKIKFAPEDPAVELGCTGCEGYINQEDIIEVLTNIDLYVDIDEDAMEYNERIKNESDKLHEYMEMRNMYEEGLLAR